MSAALDPTATPFALPHRFGASYLLFDRIGAGGMAEIYLARGKTRVGATRLAVVKLVIPALAGDARFAAMLVEEAKLAAQLSHANVVQTYDLGREEGRLYIAMEYVEGFDLNELLRRCSQARLPIPAEFAFLIVGETLRALDYAHRRKDATGRPLGIVHRDVSPSNVLISFEGEVKLCDFGIARALGAGGGGDPRPGFDHVVAGKAAYMSPEHARGDAIDGRSDVFAASIILWEMLAGRRLYKAGPDKDPLTLAREAQIPPLPDRGLPQHERLAALVAKGLEPDPAARFPTALAMARELDAYVAETRLRASPLRLGSFLTDHFATEILERRRAREQAAAAIDEPPPPAEREARGAPAAAGPGVGGARPSFPPPTGAGPAAAPRPASPVDAIAKRGLPSVPAPLPSTRPAAPKPGPAKPPSSRPAVVAKPSGRVAGPPASSGGEQLLDLDRDTAEIRAPARDADPELAEAPRGDGGDGGDDEAKPTEVMKRADIEAIFRPAPPPSAPRKPQMTAPIPLVVPAEFQASDPPADDDAAPPIALTARAEPHRPARAAPAPARPPAGPVVAAVPPPRPGEDAPYTMPRDAAPIAEAPRPLPVVRNTGGRVALAVAALAALLLAVGWALVRS